MSEANVALLRSLFDGPQSVDREALLAALPTMIPEVCDPEIEWIEDPTRADAMTYHGHDGVRESWTRWLENFEQYSVELESIADHGDRALVVAVEHGRGTTSAVDVSARVFIVVTFRAGKILRYQEFYDERAALAVLEL
jgi:ketosteroid isomerase-like protein